VAFVARAQSSPRDAGSNTCQTQSGTERGAATPEPPVSGPTPDGKGSETPERIDDGATAADRNPRRFYGAVELDPLRLTRDAEQIAEAIVEHITGLVGGEARARLEVEADVPGGVQEDVVRTVTENARTLRFEAPRLRAEVRPRPPAMPCATP